MGAGGDVGPASATNASVPSQRQTSSQAVAGRRDEEESEEEDDGCGPPVMSAGSEGLRGMGHVTTTAVAAVRGGGVGRVFSGLAGAAGDSWRVEDGAISTRRAHGPTDTRAHE